MSLQLFNFNNFEIRVLGTWENPVFVASDICNVLELSNVSKACDGIDPDEKLLLPLVIAGQSREVLCLTEPGFYRLVMRSNKPQARSFQRWVTSEVLTSIRKTGSYNIPKPFDRSTLPPTDVRMANLAYSLEYFQIDISNPRYKQSIQDLVINGIMGDTPSLPSADRWAGVAEIAEQMGYPVRVVTNHRSALGKFVALHPLESKKEIRLCNGTQRPINVYLDCPQLRSVIAEFLDTKGVAS